MQFEVIKSPTVGALSSFNPPYKSHQMPSRGVVGHNIDKHIFVCMSSMGNTSLLAYLKKERPHLDLTYNASHKLDIVKYIVN